MVWILVIVGIVFILYLSGCKKPPTPSPNPPIPVPDPDPHYWKWQQVDITTERWSDYCDYMQKITTDTLVALEMKFYKWVSDWNLWNKPDHWAVPDVVWVNKKDDCDGLARLSCDLLGRFCKYVDVHWLEYYGFYRKYTYNEGTGEWTYKVVAGGHAITVYKKDEKLLAFSNTSWWNSQDFQDFIEIGEQTFPEGIYWVVCRHWDNGKMEWQMKAPNNEILKGTNIFHRRLRLIESLKYLKRGERQKITKKLEKEIG